MLCPPFLHAARCCVSFRFKAFNASWNIVLHISDQHVPLCFQRLQRLGYGFALRELLHDASQLNVVRGQRLNLLVREAVLQGAY